MEQVIKMKDDKTADMKEILDAVGDLAEKNSQSRPENEALDATQEETPNVGKNGKNDEAGKPGEKDSKKAKKNRTWNEKKKRKKQQQKPLEDNGSAGESNPGAKSDNDKEGDVQDPSGQQDELDDDP
jgi:hypothetical protein